MQVLGLGLPELLIILLIIVILFGGKKLGTLGKSLGEGIRGFKESVKGKNEPDNKQNPDPPKS